MKKNIFLKILVYSISIIINNNILSSENLNVNEKRKDNDPYKWYKFTAGTFLFASLAILTKNKSSDLFWKGMRADLFSPWHWIKP